MRCPAPDGAGPAASCAGPAPAGQAQQPAPAAPEKVELLEQIIVKVNGEIITKTDLEARQVNALRSRGQQLSDEELRKAIAELTPDLLVDSVDELLLLQRGKELGYRVTDDQFQRVLENIRKENKLESDAQFEAALKQEGLTLAELRKNLEKQMVINQVQQVEVMGRIGVSEAEARAYYEANPKEFTTPKTVTLRELVVNVQGDGAMINVAADEAAKAKIDGALARAKAGSRSRRSWANSPIRPRRPTAASSGRSTRTSWRPTSASSSTRSSRARSRTSSARPAATPSSSSSRPPRSRSRRSRPPATRSRTACSRPNAGPSSRRHPQAPRPSDHRVEERGDAEALQRRRQRGARPAVKTNPGQGRAMVPARPTTSSAAERLRWGSCSNTRPRGFARCEPAPRTRGSRTACAQHRCAAGGARPRPRLHRRRQPCDRRAHSRIQGLRRAPEDRRLWRRRERGPRRQNLQLRNGLNRRGRRARRPRHRRDRRHHPARHPPALRVPRARRGQARLRRKTPCARASTSTGW